MLEKDNRSLPRRLFEETAHIHTATIITGNLNLGAEQYTNVKTFELYKVDVGGYSMTYIPEYFKIGDHRDMLIVSGKKPDVRENALPDKNASEIADLDGISLHVDGTGKDILLTCYCRVSE